MFGTHWHRLMDNDDFRRGWLQQAARATGRTGFQVARMNMAARRDRQLDVMADLLDAHPTWDAVLGLLDGRR